MNVKFFWLARLIRSLLQMSSLLCILVIVFNLYLNLSSSSSNIKIFGGTLRHESSGYNLKARLSLGLPDSTFYYKSSQSLSIITDNAAYTRANNETLINVVTNKFRMYANENVSLRNYVRVDQNVTIRAISKNKLHNLFWAFTEYFDLIFYSLVILVLIKLTNRYMNSEIFLPRTFKLVSYLGLLLIFSELINLVVNFVNMLLIQSPVLNTISVTNKTAIYGVVVQLNPAAISFTNIAAGLLVVLLAQVLKQAILLKQEQDLTI